MPRFFLKKTFFLKQKIISVENFFVAKLSKNLIFLSFLPVLSFIFCHLQINMLVFFVLFFLATTSIFLLFPCGLSSFFLLFYKALQVKIIFFVGIFSLHPPVNPVFFVTLFALAWWVDLNFARIMRVCARTYAFQYIRHKPAE